MKIKELREKTKDELLELFGQLKRESMNLRFQKKSGHLANSSRIRTVKRGIARILTLFNQKQQEE